MLLQYVKLFCIKIGQHVILCRIIRLFTGPWLLMCARFTYSRETFAMLLIVPVFIQDAEKRPGRPRTCSARCGGADQTGAADPRPQSRPASAPSCRCLSWPPRSAQGGSGRAQLDTAVRIRPPRRILGRRCGPPGRAAARRQLHCAGVRFGHAAIIQSRPGRVQLDPAARIRPSATDPRPPLWPSLPRSCPAAAPPCRCLSLTPRSAQGGPGPAQLNAVTRILSSAPDLWTP